MVKIKLITIFKMLLYLLIKTTRLRRHTVHEGMCGWSLSAVFVLDHAKDRE